MTNVSAAQNNDHGAIMERVLMVGDLGRLQPQERARYYNAVCESVGLNPLTRPFDYIKLSGKLTLYARKDATEQLRKLHGVSIANVDVQYTDDLVIVSTTATDGNGRSDSDVGAVTIGNLRGDQRANAIMKAVTKAKRRVTLSICGLGWLDETEIETIPTASAVNIDAGSGEIINMADSDLPEVDQSIYDYAVGDEVMVAGKDDEKPGTVVGINGALVVVSVGDEEFSVKPERLTMVDVEANQEPLFADEPNDGAYSA